MGLFFRRPLALFALLFLLIALLSYGASVSSLIFGMAVAIAVILLICVSALVIKKLRMKLLLSALCISAAVFAILQTLVCVAIPQSNANNYAGENVVYCYVIDKTDSGRYGDSYDVKVKRIGNNSVSIRAQLTCGFDTELRGGDELYGAAQILAQKGDKPSQLLDIYVDDPENCYIRYTSDRKGGFDTLFSENGIEILTGRLSDFLSNRLYSILGETRGALAMGFFTGETSGISTDIIRDFRRAGVSHLMAVSGSHIAILLGGIELILRKLLVHKNIRIITITVFSIGFLFITGFSLSAVRSVFMLYAVYISFFLRESGDQITVLFLSIAIIVFLSPHSVVDLGLWMSFLATLGLLTVYPYIEKKIPRPKKKRRFKFYTLKIGRELLLIAIMTVIANMFLLPIIWIYFREFSVIAVLSNLLITYPSSLFILTVPILLLLFPIPLLGTVMRGIVSILADTIIYAVKSCSEVPNAVISLKYEFCTYIISIFTVLMVVLLIVKLKNKFIILLPFGLAAVSFTLCFGIYSSFISSPKVTYLNYGKNEILAVSDNTELSICDNSYGGLSAVWQVSDLVDRSYATQIDKYIYTDYRKGNDVSLELLGKKYIINSVYLPIPAGDGEVIEAKSLFDLASDYGIDVVFYDKDDIIKATGDVSAQIIRDDGGNGCAHILYYCDGSSIAYSQAEYCQSHIKYDVLILGENTDQNKDYDLRNIRAERLYFSSKALSERVSLSDDVCALTPAEDKNSYSVEFDFK